MRFSLGGPLLEFGRARTLMWMTLASSNSSPGRLRRRSKRLGLSLPVQVHGVNRSGESFREVTKALSVSAHGGLLSLTAQVQEGQTISVMNKSTSEEQEVRVVYVGAAHDGRWKVGIEFVRVAANFWQVHFPAVSQKPLKTYEFSKVGV